MRLEVQQPVLTPENMEKLRHIELFSGGAFRSIELDICYPAAWGGNGMEAALASLAAHAEDAIHQGYNIIILSDRTVAADMLPIPALLATAAVHEHLVKQGAAHVDGPRRRDGIGARSAPVRAARRLRRRGDPSVSRARDARRAARDRCPRIDPKEAQKRYIKAICKGLYKVMSKMGISTYQSYCGAQIFEAVGLQKAFVDKYFTGTASTIEGIGLFEVAGGSAAPACSSRSATIRCCATRSTRAATTCIASAAKSTCGRPTRSRSCSTRRAPIRIRRTRNTRR